MSSFGAELRIDPADGNPYTRESFIETYPNGEELWEAATPWKSDGVLRIRTAPAINSDRGLPPPITEEPTTSAPVPELCSNDFPSISPASRGVMENKSDMNYSEAASTTHTHYTASLSPESHVHESMSPDAPEFTPGMETHTTMRYSRHLSSTNQDFETLPASLWNGAEHFPQPITDDENQCIDWEAMIQSWTPEQWTEFGIKYFYGYIQQSSLLMGTMPMSEPSNESETPLGAWGDE